MPIREKSTFKKHEYEYISPDEETWRIIYVEIPGRKYIQIGKSDEKEESMSTWDVAMLLDIADKIREATSKQKRVQLSHGGRPRGGNLQKPRIKDHRTGESQPERIQSQVDEAMRQSSDESTPVQSFSPQGDQKEDQEWGNFRAGFDISKSGETAETPEEYKYEEGEQGTPEDEIAARNATKVQGRAVVVKRGASGANFRRGNRVNARDLV